MLNVDLELNRLRRTLDVKGFNYEEQEYIVNQAQQDIDNTIDNIIAGAVEQVATMGVDMDAPDFLSELEIQDFGGRLQLGTKSGRTDFSLPPYPNLDNLLKNAEVAEDGSRYKVIPVGKKSTRSRMKMSFTDLDSIQQQLNQDMQERRAERKDALSEARTATFTGQSANLLSGLSKAKEYLRSRQAAQSQVETESGGGEKPEFRTASSKQDSSTDWVLPEVKKDFTNILADINKQIESEINYAVSAIINEYERL